MVNSKWASKIESDYLLSQSIVITLSAELYELRNFLNWNLKKVVWTSKIKNLNVNKITILQKAEEFQNIL